MSTRKEFFAWQDDYGVNIRPLDRQHQELADMLNRLFIAAFERKSNTVIVEMLQTLQRHCQLHFELEVRLLQQMAHKDVAAYQSESRKLLEQLDWLCKKHQREDMPVYFDMLYFLKNWLVGHFQFVDSGDLLAGGLAMPAWEQSANEVFHDTLQAKYGCGLRKAA